MLLLELADITWKISVRNSELRCDKISHLATRHNGCDLGKLLREGTIVVGNLPTFC